MEGGCGSPEGLGPGLIVTPIASTWTAPRVTKHAGSHVWKAEEALDVLAVIGPLLRESEVRGRLARSAPLARLRPGTRAHGLASVRRRAGRYSQPTPS
jgi:hypothetical protein